MADTLNELARLVRSKYPGAYDHIPDAELARKVQGKFKGTYDAGGNLITPGAYDHFRGEEVPGMEKLGRAPRPIAAGRPPGMAEEHMDLVPSLSGTGTIPPRSVLQMPGVKEGVSKLSGSVPAMSNDPRRGISDAMEGVGQVSAPFVLPVAAVGNPIGTATAVAGGIAGSKAGQKASEMMGADKETQRFVGNLGAMAGGAVGAKVSPAIKTGMESFYDITGDPATRRAAVAVLPHGAELNKLGDAISAKRNRGYRAVEMKRKEQFMQDQRDNMVPGPVREAAADVRSKLQGASPTELSPFEPVTAETSLSGRKAGGIFNQREMPPPPPRNPPAWKDLPEGKVSPFNLEIPKAKLPSGRTVGGPDKATLSSAVEASTPPSTRPEPKWKDFPSSTEPAGPRDMPAPPPRLPSNRVPGKAPEESQSIPVSKEPERIGARKLKDEDLQYGPQGTPTKESVSTAQAKAARTAWGKSAGSNAVASGKSLEDIQKMTPTEWDAIADDLGLNPSSPGKIERAIEHASSVWSKRQAKSEEVQ